MLENTENVDFYQDMVKGLLINDGIVEGVITGLGHHIKSKAVVANQWNLFKWRYSYWGKIFGGGRVSETAATELQNN
jgi:tRNA uridine 5-carboxymethylaminomethyl modification enzyme